MFTNCNLKIIQFEPIATYYADVYNTYISVVQGIALGVFLYTLCNYSYDLLVNINFDLTYLSNLSTLLKQKVILQATEIILKASVNFLIICLIWHRYVMHNQYLVWRLGGWDVLIPMFFAILQFLLSYSVVTHQVALLKVKEKTYYLSGTDLFCLFTALLYLLGFFAYLNVICHYKNNKKTMIEMYKIRLGCEGCHSKCRLHKILPREIIRFEVKGMMQMIIFAVFFFILFYLFIRYKTLSQIDKTIFFFIAFLSSGLCLLKFDMKRHLNKSSLIKTTLQDLGFQIKW